MMNCTLSTFGFILFVMTFISYYQYCSLSSSMYANLVQVCTAINREFIFPEAKKKKGMGVWNSMLIPLPCASDGVEEGK